MSYHLFLDDERVPEKVTWVRLPNEPWVIVRSFKAFTETIEEHGMPAFIAFDHDLGIEPGTSQSDIDRYNAIIHRSLQGYPIDYAALPAKTGYDCARWLAEGCVAYNKPLPDYVVHSMNPIGAENIRSILESARRAIIL